MEKVTEAFDWLMRVRDVSAPAFLEHIDSAQERVRQSSEINNQLNEYVFYFFLTTLVDGCEAASCGFHTPRLCSREIGT